MNFQRHTNLWSWVMGALLATFALTPSTAGAQHRHHRRPPAAEAVETAPPAPNPLPNSGPLCNALAGNTTAGTDPRQLLDAAAHEAEERNDDECRAVVAARQMAMGNCAQANTTIAGARTRAVGNHFVQCVSGLTRACELASRPVENGVLRACSEETRTAISELSIHCTAVSDPAAPGAAMHALFELARTCTDDGSMAAAASTIAQDFSPAATATAPDAARLNRNVEFTFLRNEHPSHHLSDAVLLARTMGWLHSGGADGPNLGVVRAQLREYLTRRSAEPNWEPQSDGSVVATIGLLGATSRILRDNPAAFGAALEDIILTSRIRSLYHPQALITARDLQIGQAFRARLTGPDARRVETAYTSVGTQQTGNAAILALRLSGLHAFQQPREPDGLTDACRRAQRLTEGLRRFLASEYRSVERRFYNEDVRVLATEGRSSAMQCSDIDTTTQSWFDSLINAVQTGAPFSDTNVNFTTQQGGH